MQSTQNIEEEICLLSLKNHDEQKDRSRRRAFSDVAPVETEAEESADRSANAAEVERVDCECCGMSEECTPTYIRRIKEFYGGKWVCGLCSEAAEEKKRKYGLPTVEAALDRHMALCKQFNTNIRPNPELSLAGAMRDFARKNSQHRAANGKTSSSSSTCSTKVRRSISCGPRLGLDNGS